MRNRTRVRRLQIENANQFTTINNENNVHSRTEEIPKIQKKYEQLQPSSTCGWITFVGPPYGHKNSTR